MPLNCVPTTMVGAVLMGARQGDRGNRRGGDELFGVALAVDIADLHPHPEPCGEQEVGDHEVRAGRTRDSRPSAGHGVDILPLKWMLGQALNVDSPVDDVAFASMDVVVEMQLACSVLPTIHRHRGIHRVAVRVRLAERGRAERDRVVVRRVERSRSSDRAIGLNELADHVAVLVDGDGPVGELQPLDVPDPVGAVIVARPARPADCRQPPRSTPLLLDREEALPIHETGEVS